MHISPTKMIFPIAVAVVGVSFVIIPIGPYAADYVMYNGYLESYGWTQTAFTIWTDTPGSFHQWCYHCSCLHLRPSEISFPGRARDTD